MNAQLVRRFGRYLGYPECCTEALVNGQTARTFNGFAMCSACAQLDLDTVVDGIAARRRHHEEFPTLTLPATVLEDFIAIDGPDFTVERKQALARLLEEKRWGLWCTLYTDASNAGGGSQGWGWGARGRIADEVADIFGVSSHFTAAGASPEAGSEGSHLGEMWAVVHGVRAMMEAWPFIRGVGVRTDSFAAVSALSDCDVRTTFRRQHPNGGPKRVAVDDVREALFELLAPRRLLLRVKHVHGHDRAGEAPQRAFNRQADSLARRAATRANREGK